MGCCAGLVHSGCLHGHNVFPCHIVGFSASPARCLRGLSSCIIHYYSRTFLDSIEQIILFLLIAIAGSCCFHSFVVESCLHHQPVLLVGTLCVIFVGSCEQSSIALVNNFVLILECSWTISSVLQLLCFFYVLASRHSIYFSSASFCVFNFFAAFKAFR